MFLAPLEELLNVQTDPKVGSRQAQQDNTTEKCSAFFEACYEKRYRLRLSSSPHTTTRSMTPRQMFHDQPEGFQGMKDLAYTIRAENAELARDDMFEFRVHVYTSTRQHSSSGKKQPPPPCSLQLN
ncbi:hypothetical protein Bbelb_311650 [Branchiostoma belcheri]|nr:hypothetical protein Bbelb_311650 [Branchiostoma belcheri]